MDSAVALFQEKNFTTERKYFSPELLEASLSNISEDARLMVDTNVILPAYFIPGRENYLGFISPGKIQEHNAYLDALFKKRNVQTTRAVIKELTLPILRTHYKKSHLLGPRTKAGEVFPRLQRKGRAHISQLKKNRLRFSQQGALVEEGMIDRNSPEYALIEKILNPYINRVSKTDSELAHAILYLNTQPGNESYLLSFDKKLTKIIKNAWQEARKEGNPVLRKRARSRRAPGINPLIDLEKRLGFYS